MSISLHPHLAEHICQQPVRLPKRSSLYDFRLSLDFASMLWCRENLMNPARKWTGHFRLDSSPQFNKNYLVGELDVLCLEKVTPTDLSGVFQSVELHTRLLPLQVLERKQLPPPSKQGLHLECFPLSQILRMPA